jgi:hypothetical protein
LVLELVSVPSLVKSSYKWELLSFVARSKHSQSPYHLWLVVIISTILSTFLILFVPKPLFIVKISNY